MRLLPVFVLLAAASLAPATVMAQTDPQVLVQQFLASITPPGARISHGPVEANGTAIIVRDVVAHAESAGGEETIHRIGQLQLQGAAPLPSGLFRVDTMRAENFAIDGAGDLQQSGTGSVRIATITASGIDGARIGALALSGIDIGASAAGSAYAIRITSATLKQVDAQALTRAAVRAHGDPGSDRLDSALLNSLLNSSSYGALQLRGLSVSKGKVALLSLAELNSDPDGGYAPFPASGNFSIRNASLDLRDPMAAGVRQWLGQDRLQFSLESRHTFSAPASHHWNTSLNFSPDAMLSGTCKAQNLSGVTSAEAAITIGATLRGCNLNFTGTEFVNGWLARDGAKQGLSAEQARAKYMAGSLLVSLDPQMANDPLATQLAVAGPIFLSQPSRLNIRLDPPAGLKFTAAIASFVMLLQGGPEQKRQAAQDLGLAIQAVPLN